jgi:hypothetical protein
MNNRIKSTGLFLTLCFSVFCFCYLNSEAAVPVHSAEMQEITESVSETDTKTNEVLLPDLRLVESVSQFAIRLFRAL